MPAPDEYRGVWVYARREDGRLTTATLEVLAAGRKIANRLGEKLVAVMLGHDFGDLVKEPIEYGADEVIYFDDARLKDYLCLPYTTVLTNLVLEKRPNALLFASDEVAKDLAPRVAYRLKAGLATDNIELAVEDYFHIPTQTTYKNLLIQIRPDFGTRVAKIYTPKHRPQIATVRQGNFTPLERDPSRDGAITRSEPEFHPDDFAILVREVRELPKSGVDLENARAVVSIGLGILRDGKGNVKNPLEGYELASQLAEAIRERYGLNTEIGASRALIYAELRELHGLISKENQVGQTGRTVSPDIYFALGISGALQHRVGMWRSRKIVAVNIDANAPIFQVAHYGIVGDLYKEVPRLIQQLGRL